MARSVVPSLQAADFSRRPRVGSRGSRQAEMAAEQKELGNAEFKAGNYEKAISFFTKSIELGGDHVLYSNRSACYAGLGKWDEALKDAESCIEKSPTWAKVRPAPLPSPHAAARAFFA